jgi:hypothetical protein
VKPRVYIAGPYSQGVVAENIRNAVLAGEAVLSLGAIPYIPHLTHTWELLHPHPYDFWIEYDLHWLPLCHALLRLPGDSKGADGEVAEAQRLGIPVFYSLDELKAWVSTRD